MRIAIFTETFLPKTDGVVNTLCRLLEYISTTNHEAILFAPEGAPPEYAGTQVIGLPAYALPFYSDLKLVNPLTRVDHSLTAFAPDLIHVAAPFACGIVGLHAAKRLGIPVVASYHTDVAGFAARWGWSILARPIWWWMRRLHNRAALNLAPSEFTRREIAEHGIRNTGIWTRGVDADRYHPSRRDADMRFRLSGGEPEKPLMLYVGRVSMEKRIDWLRHLVDATPDARLAIVGDGPARAELEQSFRGTPTVFTGYLKGDELSAAYASADIFTFPSANETFGNVALEAMASGLPTVCVNAGGPTDFVRHGETGYLTDSENVTGFVEAARSLAGNPDLVRKMGAKAREVAEHRSWNAVFERLFADYAASMSKAHGL